MKDIYAPDFPHGSVDGFNRGCTTRPVCSNHGSDEWLTCVEAKQEWNGDYNIRKLPINQPLARAAATPVAPPAKPKRIDIDDFPPLGTHGPKASPAPTAQPAEPAVLPPDATSEAKAAPAQKATRGPATRDLNDPEFPHGTNAGYQRGCRDEEACPGSDGMTCKGAKRKYNQDRADRLAKESLASGTAAAKSAEALELSSGEVEAIGEDDTSAPTGGEVHGTEHAPSPLETPDLPAPEAANVDEHIELAPFEDVDKIPLAGNEEQLLPLTRAQAEDLIDELTEKLRVAEQALEEERASTDPAGSELVPTGGGTATIQPLPIPLEASTDLGLTIEPTAAAGVRIGFTLPAGATDHALTIQVALASSDGPGLGNLAISVGR